MSEDPAIAALIARLPEPGKVWLLPGRKSWLRAMEAVFDLVYEDSASDFVVAIDPQPYTLPLLEEEPFDVEMPDIPGVNISSDVSPVTLPSTKPRPGGSRPSGIPTTFDMIRTILEEKPGLVARQVAEEIQMRWWPGMPYGRISPDISTAVNSGRLSRDADGKMTVTDLGRNVESVDYRKPAAVASTPIAPTKPIAVEKFVSSVSTEATFMFMHAGKTARLTKPELEVASALRKVIGKGFLDYAFLGLRARGVSASRSALPDKSYLSQMIPSLGAKLEPLGLRIEHSDNFGYFMKELEE